MRKIVAAIIVCVMIMVPSVVLAEDSLEVLKLRRDFLNERVLRLTAEYQLLIVSMNQAVAKKAEMEKTVPELQVQLKQYNEQITAMEAAAKVPTEPVKEDTKD